MPLMKTKIPRHHGSVALSVLFLLSWNYVDAKTVRPKPIRPLHHSSRRQNPLSVEQGLWPTIVLGSDESGTGALSGPLVTATVACLDPTQAEFENVAVRDSKALSLEQRQEIYQQVMNHPLYHCTVAIRQPEEIDQAANIQDAVHQAFGESVLAMMDILSSSHRIAPDLLLSIVDGKSSIPNLPIKSRPWIKGDTTVYTVALASIVARVTRDTLVKGTAVPLYPEYGFGEHGGYPSRAHCHALHTYGPTPYHRRSCKLIRQRDATTTTTTTRSDFLESIVVGAAATGALLSPPAAAEAMYTDKKTGIQFPEVGEIAAAIPKEWDKDELDQVLTDKSRFQRLDSSSDTIFYQEPRFVEHIDDAAVQLLTDYLNRVIVQPSEVEAVLDLCSSWTSHLPNRAQHQLTRVAGLGMNAKELQANDALTEWVVADLNEKPVLPYDDQSFDAVLCQLSIDYLTRPVQVCGEISRVLKPGGKVHILFSNRLFLQKAVAAWTGADDVDHAYTVGLYLQATGCMQQIAAQDLSRRKGGQIVGDPLYVVTAVRT